jgi:release factor glutamine methyltransferase
MAPEAMKSPRDEPPQIWTVMSLIEWSTGYLTERGFDEGRLHVELILARVLSVKRLDLYLQFDRPLKPDELASFKSLFKRRLAHEPLQYILGETMFMGLRIRVDPRVLIPRPETEVLVEHAIALLNASANPQPRVLEIGSGSGNIALSLAHLVPACQVRSFDVSADALAVARENLQMLGTRNVEFLEGDVFTDQLWDGQWDLIVSNPPYVSLDEFATLQPEVREFEPRRAVTDEADGSLYLQRIMRKAQAHLAAGGTVLVEIAYNQEAMAHAVAQQVGCWDVEVINDYSGMPRIVKAQLRRKA